VEEFHEVYIAWVAAEVFFEQDEDGGFEHEGVVDGDQVYGGEAVPAGLAAAGEGGIHYVIGDKEKGLEEFDEPAEGAGREEVRGDGVDGIREEERGGVGDGETAIEFTAEGVVVEGLG